MNNNVCVNQDTFNNSVYKALKFSEEKMKKRDNKKCPYVTTYGITHIIFLIWAVILASRASPTNRLIHMMVAIVLSPLYVIAYYLSMMFGSRLG